jgi:hypothetical protein
VLPTARTGQLQHTLNVDVTSYADGRRSTLPAKDGTPEGAADAAYVWRHFEAGCSVRMLHPQRWCDALWKVRFAAFQSFKGQQRFLWYKTVIFLRHNLTCPHLSQALMACASFASLGGALPVALG